MCEEEYEGVPALCGVEAGLIVLLFVFFIFPELKDVLHREEQIMVMHLFYIVSRKL